jgi:dienelactone hydrolase
MSEMLYQGILLIADSPAWICDATVLATAGLAIAFLLLDESRFQRIRQVLLGIPFAAVLLQIGVEGFHWQLAPAYIVSLGLLALLIPRASIDVLSKGCAASLVLLLVSLIGVILVPDFTVPAPTGPYAIGTIDRYLIDHSRKEVLADINGPRELMIQIWYPARRSLDRNPGSSFLARLRQSIALHDSRPQVGLEMPISTAQTAYPVIIYSPSWHGQRGQNAFQIEELASHGYIVIGIDHPYGSRIVVFPDGRVAKAQLVEFRDLTSDQSLQRSNLYIEKQLNVRVQDVEFLVNQLERMDSTKSGDFFSGHLDLNRMGILGYSFGGAVASEVCWMDKRIRAGIDLDGSIFGQVTEAGVSQPFMFMTETIKPPTTSRLTSKNPIVRREAEDELQDYNAEISSIRTYGGYFIGIDGTQHVDFTSPPESPTLRYYLRDSGSISAFRAMAIVNAYTLAFFDRYLKHRAEPLLNGPSVQFPEVHFAQSRNTMRDSVNWAPAESMHLHGPHHKAA